MGTENPADSFVCEQVPERPDVGQAAVADQVQLASLTQAASRLVRSALERVYPEVAAMSSHDG
jgi:hypothetical protein